ncbi:MAG TPA: amidase [Acidisphaera sp.]|nr:amidase [Acidisphaera sp.]
MQPGLEMPTAKEALRRIAAGKLTPAAWMEACLDRIDALEATVRAFVHLDREAARCAASLPAQGALHGVPIGVKDTFDTADMPSAYGSVIWHGHRPRADAAMVAWARAAGGVIMGKTVTTEFATRHPGPTTNPANAAHTPGGSSSGLAAGVAAGFFPLAFGSQTAGSVIRPAAFCGVVGFKPSFGVLPRAGMKLMSDSLDTPGVFARSVADCALAVGAIAQMDLGDPERDPGRPPRAGVCRGITWEKAAPETHALLDRVREAIARAGAVVRDVALPDGFGAMTTAHPVVMHAESAASLGWELREAADRLSDGLRGRMEWGLARPASERTEARDTMERLTAAFPTAMEELDILLTPAAPGEAPRGLDWTGDAAFNFMWTALHVPCVTVPAGVGPSGLPLGIQIVARRGEDRAALAWAEWIRAAIGT